MTQILAKSAVRSWPKRLFGCGLLCLLAAASSSCSWFTGEFSSLDRMPPSCRTDDQGSLRMVDRP
jgi:hypothetical protein